MKTKITECKEGDTFTYQANEGNKPITITLASEPVSLKASTCKKEKVCVWVTTPKDFIYPESPCSYGYTNASVEVFAKDLEVNVLHNLYDLGEEKRNEIYSMLNRKEEK